MTRLPDPLCYGIGTVFLALAKAKSILRPYATPRPFSIRQYGRCADYDLRVARNWISFLEKHTGHSAVLAGKTVLELCPGADLGTALYFLHKGVACYNAIDVHDLALRAPRAFYNEFLLRLGSLDPARGCERLASDIEALRRGLSDRLRYVVRSDFNITAAFAPRSIDLVFSQAAFEHFDDVDETIRQLSVVARPGAVAVAEIDLATHSRWIRDIDPLNIYRYGDRIYSVFAFRGAPNRVLPHRYRDAFRRFGWTNICVSPLKTVDPAALARVRSGLDEHYATAIMSMPALSIMLCATRE